MRERFITGIVLLVLAMLVVFALGVRSHATTSTPDPLAITYCETNRVGEHYETYFELRNGTEFVATDIRHYWSPIMGQWELVESPIHAKQRRVIDCVILRVNYRRTAVLTTRGGAEYHVAQPTTRQ